MAGVADRLSSMEELIETAREEKAGNLTQRKDSSIVLCQCCRQEKLDARERIFPRSSKASLTYYICEACMRDMPNPDSAAHHWWDEQLKLNSD